MMLEQIRWKSLVAGFGIAVVIAAALSLAAQEKLESRQGQSPPAADDLPFFGEIVDVNIVNVEVYVSDRDGKRITGLTKDDFNLFVDKKPVAITNFFAVESGKARENESAPTSEPTGAAPTGAAPPADVFVDPGIGVEIPDEQRLHLIVYIDNFNLRPFTRNKAINAIRGFLRSKLRASDRVMLVSYDRTLRVRHPFTSDSEVISSALFELEDNTGHGVHADSERRQLLEDIYDQQVEEITEVSGRARQYTESLESDIGFTLDALGEQVSALAGLPGRKAVLYVSDGLPLRPGEDIFQALDDRFRDTSVLMEAHHFDMSRRYQGLINQANANRVTFYTIDASGLRSYSYADASNQGIGGGAKIDDTHFNNLQTPLRMLADDTGGLAILNTNNFTPQLERVADDLRNFYSLGFSPGNAALGRYHKIKVELKGKRKGVRVRFREGFRDKTVATRMSESALAALNFGFTKNPLGVEIETGKGEPKDNDYFLVPLVVKIPIGKLTFLPTNDMQRGRVRLFIAAKDSKGGLADVQEVPVSIDIPTRELEYAKTQSYRYTMSMMMRGGSQVVSVGVRDEIGAATGFVTVGMRVGA